MVGMTNRFLLGNVLVQITSVLIHFKEVNTVNIAFSKRAP